MEKNITDTLTYFLQIKSEYKADLASIRHWENLKTGFEGDSIWVKGFSFEQINALEVKTMPFKILYYSKNSKLFLLNSLLPNKNIPSVLWTDIARVIPLELPAINPNFFGLNHKVKLELVRGKQEFEANAMLTTWEHLANYITSAPAVRLEVLKWVVLDKNQVFLVGKPILPIQGGVFWQDNSFFLPTGYHFDLPLLSEILNKKINANNNDFIVWNEDGSYFKIAKKAFQKLSLSSFRATLNINEE